MLDLLGVTFLDSTALGVLVGALKRCRELGGDLHVVVADPRIVKIFEITGLTNVFTDHRFAARSARSVMTESWTKLARATASS